MYNNFLRTILIGIAVLFSVPRGYSQSTVSVNKNYDLQIGIQPIQLVPNYEKGMELSNAPTFEGQYFKIIQFSEHPTNTEKGVLELNGLRLIAYLPHYAWLASFDVNFDPAILEDYSVRSIVDVPAAYKLATTFQHGIYPPHTVEGDQLKINVVCYKTINRALIINDLSTKGYSITESTAHHITLAIPINDLNNIIALPYVQYVEPITGEPEFEGGFVEDRSNERANYLASQQNSGLSYDGTGITIGVTESGAVEDIYNNDFVGRLNRSIEASGGATHKSGVARRMAAFGNDDPLYTGMAYGADVISASTGSFATQISMGAIATNNSYGYGCYISNYGNSGNYSDDLIYNNPTFFLSYSCGNIQTTDCGYGAGTGWGTITGDIKQAKNVIAVGAVNTSDVLMGFSSWGPAPDGRIKPDMCAVGPGGTSYASPNVVGGAAQLYHAYNSLYSTTPEAGLIKAIMQNTADDLGNPGPDFKYGYGRINMRRAYQLIADNNIITSNVANSATNNHNITVPANTKQVRIMLYWTDYEGTAGSSVALTNNLNLTVTDPNSTVYNPWVLDHTINATNLDANATRGVDALNNMEQVTIDDPTAGSYTIAVNGNSVPQGPQSYFIVYEFLEDELTLTYPIGGENMVGGETQRIYWDSYGNTSGTFDLSYSTDNGSNWTTITTGLSNDTRFYDWTVPSVVTGQALVRVQRDALSSQSSEGFSIIDVPNNLTVLQACGADVTLGWDAVANATGYEVYQLGSKYMTSVGTTTNTYYTVSGVSTTVSEYFAVRALGANNAKGRRTQSLEKAVGDVNCVNLSVGATAATPIAGYFPGCVLSASENVTLTFRNLGSDPITSLTVKYQFNGGAIITETFTGNVASFESATHTFATTIDLSTAGTYTLDVWVDPSDANTSDDAINNTITVYSSGTASYPYSQNFDGWTNCSTSWGCTSASCTLEDNWYNVPYDVTRGDTTEWRTYSGSNPLYSYSTGPSSDHTSGTGKYLFIQAVDNGGSSCANSVAHALSPCIDLTSATSPSLSFWYHAYGSAIGELHVDGLVDGVWIEDILSPIQGEKGDAWYNHSGSLVNYIGKVIVLRFRASNTSGFRGQWAIDDIKITPPIEVIATSVPTPVGGYLPDCYVSSNASTVQFQFENFGTDELTTATMKYQLNSGTVVTETFNGSVAAGAYHTYTFSTPLDLSGLTTGSHTLSVWIEHPSDVDATNNTSTVTLEIYSSGKASNPFSQNFDGFSTCSNSSDCQSNVCNLSDNWYNLNSGVTNGDDADWLTFLGSTPTGANPSYETGPSGDHTSGTGKYLYTETSSGTGCQNSNVYLLSPCIDLTAYTSPELSFWYHMYGSSSGEIHVDAFVDGAWTPDITQSINGAQGNSWLQGTANLVAYKDMTIVLRFRAITGGGFLGDMAIDDISISDNLALPVEFARFTATAIDNNYIQLDWTTATEQNNHGFEVWRSTDGKHFETIGFVAGQGNSNVSTKYLFEDRDVKASQWYYYRLHQVDFDGTTHHSNLVSARIKDDNNTIAFSIGELFPNPTNGTTSLRITGSSDTDIQINILNQLGQIVRQQNVITTASDELVTLNTNELAAGIYFVQISNVTNKVVRKLVVQ